MSTSYQLRTTGIVARTANRETISLLDTAGNAQCTVVDSKRLQRGVRERQPSKGQYLGTEVDWRLPAANVSGTITPGCSILDSGSVNYVVLDVDPPDAYAGVWRCFCLSLMVLGRRITWKLPTDLTDAAASPLTDQSASLPEMACAIQEVGKEEVLFQGVVQGFRYHYDVWIVSQARLPLGTIGVDDRGYVYEVKGQRNRNRLDELNCIECIVNP